MIFTELRFFLFFAVVFSVYWTLGGRRLRKVWLLLGSYFFYAAWDWRFLGLIVTSTLIDYVVGLQLARYSNPAVRRRWLLVSLFSNLGILGVFKYFDFFADSLVSLLGLLGLQATWSTVNLVLPVGISFYTFQTLSYSIDVYRGELEPTRNLLDLALFVAFFPQLVAGPIVRARDFLPQLDRDHAFSQVAARPALTIFLSGFVKKACVADNIARFVDQYFADPLQYGALSAWIAILLYGIQIYCDFSGYSDMAIGTARLLGYELGQNFNFPYLATSMREFWRRWHISLSTWLRDYLYIPLGGNRGSRWATRRNLMVTMLLGGLWHGAAWTFVVWGGLHGLALVVNRLWTERARFASPGMLRLVGGWGLTFLSTHLAWVFFRAQSLSQAVAIVRSALFLGHGAARELPMVLFGLIGLLAAMHLAGRWSAHEHRWARLQPWQFSIAYGVGLAVALVFVHPTAQPFIYFQF